MESQLYAPMQYSFHYSHGNLYSSPTITPQYSSMRSSQQSASEQQQQQQQQQQYSSYGYAYSSENEPWGEDSSSSCSGSYPGESQLAESADYLAEPYHLMPSAASGYGATHVPRPWQTTTDKYTSPAELQQYPPPHAHHLEQPTANRIPENDLQHTDYFSKPEYDIAPQMPVSPTCVLPPSQVPENPISQILTAFTAAQGMPPSVVAGFSTSPHMPAQVAEEYASSSNMHTVLPSSFRYPSTLTDEMPQTIDPQKISPGPSPDQICSNLPNTSYTYSDSPYYGTGCSSPTIGEVKSESSEEMAGVSLFRDPLSEGHPDLGDTMRGRAASMSSSGGSLYRMEQDSGESEREDEDYEGNEDTGYVQRSSSAVTRRGSKGDSARMLSPGRRLAPPVPVPNLTKKSRGRRVPTNPIVVNQNGIEKNVRMYRCKVAGCNKCFQRGEHLKRHVRSIHTNEKPHKCPYAKCGKDFSRHDNLRQHMRVHRNEPPPS